MKKAKLLQALLCATALATAPAFADDIDGSVSVFSAEDLSPAAFLDANFETQACFVVAAMKAEALDDAPSFAAFALADRSFNIDEQPIATIAMAAPGLEAPASADTSVAILALANARFEDTDDSDESVMVAATEADEAPTLADAEDGGQVLAANELENLAGGTGVSSSILTEQNLTAINGGNSVSGYTVGSGQINIGAGAFQGFDGVGNFVLNTGHNNNLQSSMNVSIVVGQ